MSTQKEILLAGTFRTLRPSFCTDSERRCSNHLAFSFRSWRSAVQPDAPKDSKVMNKSNKGLIEARPGYKLDILSTKAEFGAATMAPPTGTRKFLSVLWTNASIRPRRHPDSMRCVHFEHCKPYALLMTCATLRLCARTATSSTKSGTRGANVEVVVQMQSTCSAPTFSTAAFMPSTSVPIASVPSMGLSSTTIGVKPAAPMALKQDFWSILDQTTYLP
mmetsp:Transcript_30180/g.54785  ORF Transcript_30180/g.54785 Transcript_30180/m.54785 type:complete len:219 (-) Transcript_30180:532-1188(-)